MPLEHVVISYVRDANWLNVLMLKSVDILQPYTNPLVSQDRRIEVNPYGFRWLEAQVEQRVPFKDMFEVNHDLEDQMMLGHAEETGIDITFGLSLKRINHFLLERNTVNVELEKLRMTIDENVLSTLYCSQCANEIVQTRCFGHIRPFPVLTMRPETCFATKYPVNVYPRDDGIFFGLNYIVVSPRVLGTRGILYFSNAQGCSVVCGRCRQLLGEVLGDGVAILLYADTIRSSPFMSFQLNEIFKHVNTTQIMLRLLYDGMPMNAEKSRLFLKCIRPDGQHHYLVILEIRPIHIFRSKVCLTDDIDQPVEPSISFTDSSSEGSQDTDTSSTSSGKRSDHGRAGNRAAKRQRSGLNRSVTSVDLEGYRGRRLKYLFFRTDEEIANATENLQEAITNDSLVVRISYVMLMELVNELNYNEQMVASLEKLPPAEVSMDTARLSYILFKHDGDS
ncbi:uncharacterized protein Dwil_GK11543 [Drosophila willistoni]|uniref:Uncharacterized protein n=1 Tax=Drosophila willistoni TaxID=7260 RepID=B4N8X8_DROWI|nr:uncharacterized protein LOC6648113 [Drosophila willistoni]EDW80483.1 uncharacterized protein Dwil_GK11543 [Drosophila willistoni]